MENQNLLASELHIDPIGYTHLKETAMWAKFLAIVGFVLSIGLAIVAFFIGTILGNLSPEYAAGAAMGSVMITVVYLFIAAVYFFMSLFLFRFAVKMKTALLSNDQQNLNASLFNLKIVYRMLGIIMVVYLGLIALGLIAVIGFAAMS
ncbi:MAG: hypothetical protein WKF35_05510 [Ferruginibacter sp.]